MKPMLAKPYDAKLITDIGYFQPKLDGMRMVWTGTEALSRTGKPIVSVPSIIEVLKTKFKGVALDGELYAHGIGFENVISSTRRTKNVEEDPRVQYHVYDAPMDAPFSERFKVIADLGSNGEGRIVPVETVPSETCTTVALSVEREYVSQGYEGAMWRSADGHYEFGKRSKHLVKIKSFMEHEFVIKGFVELMNYEKVIVPAGTPGAKQYADGRWWKNGNGTPQGTLGALVLADADGREFECGSGFSDAVRDGIWALRAALVGTPATVKYFELTDGGKGVPRFPVFKALRDYE